MPVICILRSCSPSWCLRFSSSAECWTFQLCYSDKCRKLWRVRSCRSSGVAQCLFRDLDPEVDARPASSSAALVVNNGSGMYFTGLLVFMHLALFPTTAHSRHGEVCTVDASPAEQFFLTKTWTTFLRAPCTFQICSAVGTLRQVFFWEPSTTKSSSLSRAQQVAGSPGVLTPR